MIHFILHFDWLESNMTSYLSNLIGRNFIRVENIIEITVINMVSV